MSDERTIHQVVKHLEHAWNDSDSVAFATVFSPDADFIHILGGHFQGRTTIDKGHRQIFDTIYRGSSVRYDVERIRFIRPDVAVVFVLATLEIRKDGDGHAIQSRPTMVLEKSDGIWQIVAFQNTLVGEPRPFEDPNEAYPKRE